MSENSPLSQIENTSKLTSDASLEKSQLRFMTCGSVDDGKSTLIGRILYETGNIPHDQVATLRADSRKFGTTGEEFDYALLVDGLSEEREQGITIDIAYRYFETDMRKFIVIDTPGHEQYTRNMATGASHAQLAIIMIDSRKGFLPQSKRHCMIASMLGIKHIVLAVNKMDLVNYSETVFNEIFAEFQKLRDSFDFSSVQAIPLSSLKGDNVVQNSKATTWYNGPSLFSYLSSINIDAEEESNAHFRMPVQWVNRTREDFRGYAGEIISGEIAINDPVMVLPSRKLSKIKQIITFDSNLEKAYSGTAVTLALHDEIDISRGHIVVSKDYPLEVADIFKLKILWVSEKPMISGRQYVFKCGTSASQCTLSRPDYCLDVNTFEHLAAKTLNLNEIGVCDAMLDQPIGFDTYEQNKCLGSFILIDKTTNETVAMGMILHAMRRSENVHAQRIDIDRHMREALKDQRAQVLWMTGLSGAGKSTIANLVEQKLYARNKHTMILDGDNVRRGLNRDLGFSEADRAENIRRIAEVARLMIEAGTITIVSFISPYESDREMARHIIGDEAFTEIFINAPLEVVEKRDTKGLYKKARAGEIPNFTGINSPYEIPLNPDIILNTSEESAENLADQLIDYLIKCRKIEL